MAYFLGGPEDLTKRSLPYAPRVYEFAVFAPLIETDEGMEAIQVSTQKVRYEQVWREGDMIVYKYVA